MLCTGMWKRKLEAEVVKFLWKRKHFEERSWKRNRTRKHLTFWGAGSGSIFHKTWGRNVEADAVEAVKFLWKRKHFEERRWKRKQTRKWLTLYGARCGSKIYSTAFHIPGFAYTVVRIFIIFDVLTYHLA